MERQRTRLGARKLTDNELKAILPNADSVEEQIKVFRGNIPEPKEVQKDREIQQVPEQKTNNIGIMGRRGAGKTSILRTFHSKLTVKKDNYKDIILPIIIPENMSPGATLMDVVLGMMKSVMKEKKKPDWGEDCIYSGRNELEKSYNELIRQYCYIKKDYRDILIQQFTTEQLYVDKTKQVFNSDTEFINKFNEFVEKLLGAGQGIGKKAMLFLFIDDIDLSTNRCMDVVRTLLSYLSNPRIVTFISGDMKTFEEALTLEFLRQENALDAGLLDKTFYSAADSLMDGHLLDRKKTLAYEYLKKIIPPAYRKNIKYWSLEERGHYQISDEDGKSQKELGELLAEITEKQMEMPYFIYWKEKGKGYLDVTFHMFDDTSRGLNNVYNVAYEICAAFGKSAASDKTVVSDKTDDSDRRIDPLMLQRLIETMVDSQPLYAGQKELLLRQIIEFTQKGARVDFRNAYNWLFYCDSVTGESVSSCLPEERFAYFLLIDFAARLFQQKDFENSDYIFLKNRVLEEYIQNERIDGKIVPERDKLVFSKIKKDIDALQKGPSVKTRSVPRTIRWILLDILNEGDFLLGLYLVRFLGREKIYQILQPKKESADPERENAYKVAYALSQAVWAIYQKEKERKEYLSSLYLRIEESIQNLLEKLSLNPEIIYGEQILQNMDVRAYEKNYLDSPGDSAEANVCIVEQYIDGGKEDERSRIAYIWKAEYLNQSARYWLYFERCQRENARPRKRFDVKYNADRLVRDGLSKTIMIQLRRVLNRYKINELKENVKDLPDRQKDKRQKQAILEIDAQKLWNCRFSKDVVKKYIEKRKDACISRMYRKAAVFDATEFITGAYERFLKCEEGISGTAHICKLKRKFREIQNQFWKKSYLDGRCYMRLDLVLVLQCMLHEFLENHPRIRYGKVEVRQLLMESRELPYVISDSRWNAINNMLKKMEEDVFSKVTWLKKEWGQKSGGEGLEQIIEKAAERFYNMSLSEKNNGTTMEDVLKNCYQETGISFSNSDETDRAYLRYLVQKKQLENLKSELQPNPQPEQKAAARDAEDTTLMEDALFYIQSHLRYRQATDSKAAQAGVQAERIAELAQYLLDSEVIMDLKLQNEVFEQIAEKLDMTEEEFDCLFQA